MEEEQQELGMESESLEEFETEPEVTTTEVVVVEELPTKLKKRGAISLKHRMIAEMAARSYPISVIAQELHMKQSTVYNLLEKNEVIWDEINKAITAMFAEGDRILANLRLKALVKLDEQLNSSDAGISASAVSKILKITDGKEGGDKTAIFIGAGGKSDQGIESVDTMILRMRKERGLPIPEVLQDKSKE
jgi:hypothetical protein